MSQLLLTTLLYEAVNSPLGTVVETPDPEFLRQKLYAVRKQSPDFANLSFVISPLNGKDLWIINKGNSSDG